MSTEQSQFVAYRSLVGQAVAQRRKQLGHGQAALASALGVTQANFSRLETGQSAFSVDQIADVARFLGTTPSDLLAVADDFGQKLQERGYQVVPSPPKSGQNNMTPLVGAGLIAALLLLATRK